MRWTAWGRGDPFTLPPFPLPASPSPADHSGFRLPAQCSACLQRGAPRRQALQAGLFAEKTCKTDPAMLILTSHGSFIQVDFLLFKMTSGRGSVR